MVDCYRSCASILLLRGTPTSTRDGARTVQREVLILRKPRKRDCWQLPQGGVEEGETIEQAALRELREEAGIGARVLATSTQCYQYDFPASYRRFRPDHVCGQCIRFVIAIPDGSENLRVDGKEIEAGAWVSPKHLPRYIKRRKYLRIVLQILQEADDLLQGTGKQSELLSEAPKDR